VDSSASSAFFASSLATPLPGLHILHPMGQAPTRIQSRLGIYTPASLMGGSNRESEGCGHYPTPAFAPRTGHFYQESCPTNSTSGTPFERTAQCRLCQRIKGESKLQGLNHRSAARAETKHIEKTGDTGAKQGGELTPP